MAHAQSKAAMKDARWVALKRLAHTWPIPVLPIGGKDLLATGIAAGPGLGKLLEQAQDFWISRDFKPSREELMAHIESVME